ncbi:MAG: MCE family protein [Actinomycetota bacterium]|nr:MCE family protein [Actinomycetota bacterium]
MIFVLMTLIGVTYVGTEYVGLTKGLFSNPCTISADFPDSGGIFSNAEVTYRGVSVGRVGKLDLLPNGVRAHLDLANCNHPKIPASAIAVVSNRSVIGEQFVNLLPPNDNGPYLTSGHVIPMSGNSIPIPTQVLLTNLDNLVKSVDTTHLETAIAELGKAFNDQGPALGALLDASNNLLAAAQANLPDTLALIKASAPALQTQLDENSNIQSFSSSLNLLSQQLKSSDADIRSLLTNGPNDLSVISTFVNNNKTDLGVVFNNLASTGQLLVRHLPATDELFELYPALAAGSFSVLRTDSQGLGTGYLGLIINSTQASCGNPASQRDGYDATVVTAPSNLSPHPANTAAHCNLPPSSNIDVRGSQNVPGGDPISTAGNTVAYPRVSTANTINVGSVDGSAAVLGDKSWIAMLTDGLH